MNILQAHDKNNIGKTNSAELKKEGAFYAQVACGFALLPVLILGIVSAKWAAALHLFCLGPITTWPLLLFAWQKSLLDMLLCCIGVGLGIAGAVILLFCPPPPAYNNNNSAIITVMSNNQHPIPPTVFFCLGCGLCIGCVQMLHIIIMGSSESKRGRLMVATAVAAIVASLSIASIIIIIAASMTTRKTNEEAEDMGTARRLFQSAALPFVLLFFETATSNQRHDKNVEKHHHNIFFHPEHPNNQDEASSCFNTESNTFLRKFMITNNLVLSLKNKIAASIMCVTPKAHDNGSNKCDNILKNDTSFQQRIIDLNHNKHRKPLLLFSHFLLSDKPGPKLNFNQGGQSHTNNIMANRSIILMPADQNA